jgi:hypothetical protein
MHNQQHIPRIDSQQQSKTLPWRPPTIQQHHAQVVWCLILILMGLLGMLPGLLGIYFDYQPIWTRVAIVIGLWQLALAGWVITIPDWIGLSVATWTYALIAAFYGAILAILLATPAGEFLPWGLNEIRQRALLWSVGMVFFSCLICYAVGNAAAKWRRQVRKDLRRELEAQGR